ncbi:P-selectin glycoprotein ligand 1 [Ciconia boyciana]|uniref:P-selectin glycoprotein ligand 1 n=1 Tax=Ciconia boyciana TaxID=52775 RepID=UPI003BA3A775
MPLGTGGCPAPGLPSRPCASAAGPLLVMPAGAAARGPAASPGRGPMAAGWTVLVMLVLVLVLSTLRVCAAVTPLEPGQRRGMQWVWGVAGPARAEPLPLSRRKRADGGQQPSTTTATLGHSRAATTMPSSDDTDSPEPDPLLGSVPPPAPGTNASLHRVLVVPTTADPLDETDSPEPDLLLSSAPAPSTNASLHQEPAVPTTADPLDETDSPEPDLLLSSVLPAVPGTNSSLHWAPAALTTADPQDETDSPDPDLLPDSAPPAEPSTQAAAQNNVTTVPSWLTPPGEEGTVADGTDSSSSAGPRSGIPPAFGLTTTGYKKVREAGASPAPTHSAPWDMKPRGTAVPVPWDPSRVMGKCLLAILLLALVAATFMVCTGMLGALLWRRARTAHRRLSRTEMVCISSLLPDGEVATNGPKPGPARRPKLLLDGSSEVDSDNLTLSSFLPEHS